MKKTTQTRPFFVRFLEEEELNRAAGGDAGGTPNSNAADAAFANNPNAGQVFISLKAGTCGNDCDYPGGGGDFLIM